MQRHLHQLLPTQDRDPHGVGPIDHFQLFPQGLARLGEMIADQQNQVVGLEAGPGGGRAGANLVNVGGRPLQDVGHEVDAQQPGSMG